MAASRSSVHASFSPTETSTKLKLHHSKKGLTAMKVVHLLHRTGILVAAIVYFVFCVKATKLTIEILRGKDNPVMSPPPSDVSLLRTALGTSATTIRDTSLYRAVVHDDGTPAGGTLYLEKSGASFKACARMSPLATEIVADEFQRSIYDAIVLGAGYNLTFLVPDSIELIAPIVDCSSTAVVEGYVSSTRMTYLVRDRRTSADVSILTVDLHNQEYFIKAQKEHGPAGVAIISLVKDLQPTATVDYHFLVALEYPYEEPEFDVYTFLQVDDEGMWSLQHIPEDPKKELPFVLTTAFRTGFFLKSETQQSTMSNEVPILAQTPLDAITRVGSASKTVQYDSWAWVHLVQLLFGLNLLLNLLILLTVVFHNLRAGKFWIGDAFVPISSTTTIRGAIVLVAWGVSGFWSFYELAYHDTYEILGISTIHAYDDIVRADLMCLYLMICGLMGTVFRERIDPLLAMICFEIGFESRRSISQWFPSAVTAISSNGYTNFFLSRPPILNGQTDVSPMNSWRPHEVIGGSSAFVWAQLSSLLTTLVVIFAYIVYCKIHRYLYPEKYRMQRSSNTTGASGREEAALLHKRVLTLFEIATGAELESKFGVLSSYKNYLFIKGMKFASADGIYSNGFVIVNGKYLVEANDLWTILLMKLLRKRYTNVYAYEITGSTVQQTAKLVYPHTFTLTDLWYLNVKLTNAYPKHKDNKMLRVATTTLRTNQWRTAADLSTALRRSFASWGGAGSFSESRGRGGRRSDSRGSYKDSRDSRSGRDNRSGGLGRGDYRRGGGGGRDRASLMSAKTVTNDGEPIPQIRGEGVYGIHSVLQVLESRHRAIYRLYVRDPAGVTAKKSASDAQALERIKTLAAQHGVEMATTSKWMLNHITSDKPHQGVVLDADPIRLPEFAPQDPSAFATSPRQPVILALDELHDPQNFGAILRSAHFLGCSAVLMSERNSAPLSPAASRASAGAMEVLVANNKLFKARNLHEALAVSRDMGWRVIGACSGPNSITSNELGSDKPTILVMGNEHRGMRKGIRQTCDDIVTIPDQTSDDDSRVDSLNVSVAAAILLYELLHH